MDSDPVNAGFIELRACARKLRSLNTADKNQALLQVAAAVKKNEARILEANILDLARLPENTAPSFRDRLTLTASRIDGMIESLRQVAGLPDPVGEIAEERTLKNGLEIRRVRAPLGVILMIFESRPNVILEAFSLAFKSGNAIALRGGSESRSTAEVLYTILTDALRPLKLEHSFHGVNDYDRALVEKLLKRSDWFDVVVPRGGEKLIEFVQKTALMPIIKNDRGLCHAYVDSDADLEMAVKIVTNGKIQRPGVCNALETVLVHREIAADFLPKLFQAAVQLEWRCDEESRKILPSAKPAQPSDWNTEHLDLILNCRVVGSLEEAIQHIDAHGSKHSEAIITRDETKARTFQTEVDAAAVYWNASTRFTDGFALGLGGELGISTQKLHVRGPVGLRELTTPRWIITGTGQVRE